MVHVIVENRFEQPVSERELHALMCGPCFEIYNVFWEDCLLSEDGRGMLCWFKGPDAESVRVALRNQGLQADRVWSGIVQQAFGGPPISTTGVNLVVEIQNDHTIRFQQDLTKSTPAAKCPRLANAWLECAIISLDGQRQLCLFRAEAVDQISELTRLDCNKQRLGLAKVWTSRSLALCLHGGNLN